MPAVNVRGCGGGDQGCIPSLHVDIRVEQAQPRGPRGRPQWRRHEAEFWARPDTSPNHAPSTPLRHATLWRGPLPQPPCQLGRHTDPVECPGSAPAAQQGCGSTSTQHTPTTPPPVLHTAAAKALSEATQPHLTAPPARSTGHKCCPRNPRGRGNQRSHAGGADGSPADAAAWAAARDAARRARRRGEHPACVASPAHAHGSQTDSRGWGACWAASRRLLAGARRYAPSLRLHKGDINAVEAGARAWRIRSGRDRGDPGASGRAAIAARAHAPGDIRSRAGSVDQSRARRRAAEGSYLDKSELTAGSPRTLRVRRPPPARAQRGLLAHFDQSVRAQAA